VRFGHSAFEWPRRERFDSQAAKAEEGAQSLGDLLGRPISLRMETGHLGYELAITLKDAPRLTISRKAGKDAVDACRLRSTKMGLWSGMRCFPRGIELILRRCKSPEIDNTLVVLVQWSAGAFRDFT
jgi:hypothetical protein